MAERYIPEHRRNNFKAKGQFKPDELRRRREEQQVEIRRQKREENLAKRRGIGARDGSSAPGASLGAAPDSDDEGLSIESQVSQRKPPLNYGPCHCISPGTFLIFILLYMVLISVCIAKCRASADGGWRLFR